jgi:DNA-binding transcriptional LysR family regulator
MTDLRSLSIRQFRALAATLSTGSVTAAANLLHVTPPAISAQLKAMERAVGGPLFERTADGFVPTEIGREVLATAHVIDNLIARTGERITALQAGAQGSVVLGVVSTGKYFAPRIVAAFQQAQPQIRVTLAIGNREEIIKGLERRAYDLVIMGRPPPHVRVDSVVLGDHPHVLIAPPDHRLVGDHQILPEDLQRETFLAREEGSGTRMLTTRFLERFGAGRSFNVIEMGTNETIKQAVMAGLGIAMISAHTCYSELADGKLAALHIHGLPIQRQWFLIHRSDQSPSKAAQVFRTFLLSERSALIPNLNWLRTGA